MVIISFIILGHLGGIGETIGETRLARRAER